MSGLNQNRDIESRKSLLRHKDKQKRTNFRQSVRPSRKSRENGTQKLRKEYDQTKHIKLNIDQTRKDRNHPLEEQGYLKDQTRRRLDQDRNIKKTAEQKQ